jgi:hypothetical protein
MNGWLGLIHQGLSPWKKRQASLGAPTKWLSGSGEASEMLLTIIAHFLQAECVPSAAKPLPVP